MTLIAAYSYEPNTTVFVNDFRTSIISESLRFDNAFKFQPLNFGGMFLAGNVNSWNIIFEKESTRLNGLESENFIEELRGILQDYAFSPTPILRNSTRLYALGFVINKTDQSNKAFYIDYTQGMGAIVNELDSNKVYIFGSGADIEGLSEHLNAAMLNYTSDPLKPAHLKEPYLVADVFEKFISNYIENLKDPSIYERKGISNVFAYSFVTKDYFKMCSYSEKKFIKGEKLPKQFTFEKEESGNIVLKDITHNVDSKLSSLDQLDSKGPIIIDPFNREKN
ncbi:hypothetical protein CN900_24595 [Bacillus anthracis]|uniref:hypothetical protein n=1 Tax=Bacillus tropicus TaxID=2026188 RepID=UPI000BFDDC9B|nr:hypothetical protein [Bacillus tropicus]PGH86693.1 hypothetical protein CN900_24595 [Bacillus anthracis]PGV30948.1 hypothetical protein COD75_26390 [Bacillus anthracis]